MNHLAQLVEAVKNLPNAIDADLEMGSHHLNNLASEEFAKKHPAMMAAFNWMGALADNAQVVRLTSPEDDPIRRSITCRYVPPNAARGNPAFYVTAIGAWGNHQLYRNEAEALWLALGKALWEGQEEA